MDGRRSRRTLVAFVFAFALYAPGRLAAQASPINVLFFSSMDLASVDMVTLIDAIKTNIKASGRHAEIYAESLDLLRLPPIDQYREGFLQLLAARYGRTRIDIILAQSSQATETAVLYRDNHSQKTPIYCFDMLDTAVVERYSKVPGIYGRPLGDTLMPNLRMASRLLPKAKKAYLLVTIGNTKYVQSFYDNVEAARAKLPALDFRVYVNTSFTEVEAALSSAGKDSFAFISPGVWRLPSGDRIAGTELVDRLSAEFPIPYFSGFASLLGTGLMGGAIIDRSRMGREASEMILSILYSENKPSPWLYADPSTPTLDYRALKKFSVPNALIPPEAKLLYEPPSSWVAYERTLKIFGAFLIVSFLALIAWSLFRRREARILRESNERLEWTVSRRTEELKTANAELEASNGNLRLSLRRIEGMQDRLVTETRETILGRIALSLAHEINNPLAVIRSSLHSICGLIGGGDQDLISTIMGMDAEGAAIFDRLLAEARKRPPALDDEDSYARRLALEARLKALGLFSAGSRANAADLLVDAGLSELGDDELALACSPERGRIIELLYRTRLIENGVVMSSQAVERINQKVEDMRSYARDSAENQEGESASVVDSMERALSLLHEVNKGDVSVRRRFDAGLPHVAAADTGLVRVWANLFQNAIQAMNGRGEIELAARLEGDEAVVEVLDAGPGVPLGLRDQLFTPFASTKGIDQGMSLGLPICKRIVEGCGGMISYGERDGRTMFTVRLPIAKR